MARYALLKRLDLIETEVRRKEYRDTVIIGGAAYAILAADSRYREAVAFLPIGRYGRIAMNAALNDPESRRRLADIALCLADAAVKLHGSRKPVEQVGP